MPPGPSLRGRLSGYLTSINKTVNCPRRKHIPCFGIDSYKRKPKRPGSLATLVTVCIAGFASSRGSVPDGPGQPLCLLPVIISLFILAVNSFLGSRAQKQPGQASRDSGISTFCTSHRRKSYLEISLVSV